MIFKPSKGRNVCGLFLLPSIALHFVIAYIPHLLYNRKGKKTVFCRARGVCAMKHIIFDIGNVLLSFHPKAYLLSHFSAPTAEALMSIVFESEQWIELDRGALSYAQAIALLSEKHPAYAAEIAYVLQHWTQLMAPMARNVALAEQLKANGYSLYLLSNFHREAVEILFEKYAFFSLFDGRIVSAYEHCLKPEPAIYRRLLARYGLCAQDCVFIDDTAVNIRAAECLGICGIHLPYGADLTPALKNLALI